MEIINKKSKKVNNFVDKFIHIIHTEKISSEKNGKYKKILKIKEK